MDVDEKLRNFWEVEVWSLAEEKLIQYAIWRIEGTIGVARYTNCKHECLIDTTKLAIEVRT